MSTNSKPPTHLFDKIELCADDHIVCFKVTNCVARDRILFKKSLNFIKRLSKSNIIAYRVMGERENGYLSNYSSNEPYFYKEFSREKLDISELARKYNVV